jgi:hypothetical protein
MREEGSGVSVEGYLRHLLDEDEQAASELEGLALEGLDSGPAMEIGPGYWEAKHQRLDELLKPMHYFEAVTTDLFRVYGLAGEGLTEQDVSRWSELTGLARGTLYDQIALLLARGFHNGELPFDLCDRIVNDILVVITYADECRPEIYWETFLAFDAGEYYHDNNREEDPVEAYTKPRIACIVAKHGEADAFPYA